MARIVDGPEITGQVTHKQTGQAYGPVTVTVSPKVYTDREMTASVTSLTTDGTGVFSCYAPPGTYTFTTTAVDAATIESVEVLGREGGTGVATAASSAALIDKAAWVTATVYAVGDVVTQGGHRYAANTAHTASAAFATDAAKWTQLSLEPVASVNGLTGAVSVPDVATALLGQVNGAAISPGAAPPPIGPELWVLSNFLVGGPYNSSTLTPSLTANSTAQTSRTLVALGDTTNQDTVYRVKLNVSANSANGWGTVSLRIVTSGGTNATGTNEQRICTNTSPAVFTGQWQEDIKVAAWGLGTLYLEVHLEFANNATSGTLSIDSVSIREVGGQQRPLAFGDNFVGGGGSISELHTRLFDPVSGGFKSTVTQFSNDGALTTALGGVGGWNTDRPFRYDPADWTFAAATLGINVPVGSTEQLLATGEVSRSVRVNNNDQILEVQKADLSYELRGNTHGGETNTSAAVLEADYGAGTWTAWNRAGQFLHPCRRFRFTYPTQIARSAPDSDVFATVTHVATFYPDGVMRMDRTTTFTKTVRLRAHFEWMSSHDTATPAIGRIGAGLLVLDEVDVFPKIAVPVIGATSTATTGGTLAAATYAYVVTAIGPGGESTPAGPVTQTTTGTTSTVTVNWTAAPNALGHRVYGRINATGALTLLATVGPTTATWVDDGSATPTGQQPPTVNLARRLDQTSIASDSAVSDHATWAGWFDPIAGIAYGNIYDRDSTLARANVAGVKTRLEGVTASIRKNYLNVYWTGDGNPSLPTSETQSITSGTVWTATHWFFAYCPADVKNYHLELAARAASITQLKTLYPAV